MPARTKVLVAVILTISTWAASGIGANVGKSDVRPGGEVGWYFTCIYFAPHRSFEVNYSYAPRAPAGSASFWEKRDDCPAFAHVKRAVGWRH